MSKLEKIIDLTIRQISLPAETEQYVRSHIDGTATLFDGGIEGSEKDDADRLISFLGRIKCGVEGDFDGLHGGALFDDKMRSWLEATVIVLNKAYRQGTRLVSDEAYDSAFLKLLDGVYPQSDFFLTPSGGADDGEGVIDGEEVTHTRPMLSTDKAYTKEDLELYFRRVHKVAESIGIPKNEILYKVTSKLDGIACRDEQGVLATRGNDGLVGKNITKILDRGAIIAGDDCGSYPEGKRGLGDGEIVVDNGYFNDHIKDAFDMDHPRNFIIGFCGADTLKEHHLGAVEAKAIKFVPYKTLPKWLGDEETLMANYDAIFDQKKQECPYLTDGMIIEVVDESIKSALGHNNHHHRWMLAFKRNGETAQVKVKEVAFQVGRTGIITPVLNFDPVKLSGANVSRATCSNAKMLLEKGAGVGSVIEILRSGEVIPALQQVVEPVDAVLPESCPCCGNELAMDGVHLVCDNKAGCSDQASNALEHFFKIMKVLEFGAKTCEKLVAGGYKTIPQVLGMSTQDFIELGFGDVMSRKLKHQQLQAKMTPVEDWRLLASIGMPKTGRGKSKDVLKHFTLDQVIAGEVTFDALFAMKGFKERLASVISNNFIVNRDLIDSVRSHVADIIQTKVDSDGGADHPLEGLSFVFTGTFESGDRDFMKAHCEDRGGKAQGSVNGKTNYLVCGAKVGKSKTTKAQDLGVKVISEEEYFAMV